LAAFSHFESFCEKYLFYFSKDHTKVANMQQANLTLETFHSVECFPWREPGKWQLMHNTGNSLEVVFSFFHIVGGKFEKRLKLKLNLFSRFLFSKTMLIL
jgi:hypothetical protein